jgi:carbonic anhydrase/acetyltransferase-like protein (isoleucine patch superfamily)
MSVNMKYAVRKSPDGVGYVIIAAREIKTTVGVVPKGTMGGFLLRGNELSQGEDNSWVFPEGKVYDGKVIGNAVVFGTAIDSNISGNAVVGAKSHVERSTVKNQAIVSGRIRVYNSKIHSHAVIHGISFSGDKVDNIVIEDSKVGGRAVIWGNGGSIRCAVVNNHAKISDGTVIESSTVGGYASLADCVVYPGNRIYTGIYRGDSIAEDTIRQKPNMD